MKRLFPLYCFLVFGLSLHGAEEVVGHWHDRASSFFDRKITIFVTDSSIVQRSEFTDGSSVNRPLAEIEKKKGELRRFLVVGSPSRDGCAIRSDGDLDIFDQDGVMRIAKRIPPNKESPSRSSQTTPGLRPSVSD